MPSNSGHLWHCTNRACSASLSISTEDAQIHPQCCLCGAPVKRAYTSPVFRYLDFLRVEEPSLAESAGSPVAET